MPALRTRLCTMLCFKSMQLAKNPSFSFCFPSVHGSVRFLTLFFSPPHFYFIKKVLNSWDNNDIVEDSMFNQYISALEQERWKGNHELHTFLHTFLSHSTD